MEEKEEVKHVWVCKVCLRVTMYAGGPHATAPDKQDAPWCTGEFIKKPIW